MRQWVQREGRAWRLTLDAGTTGLDSHSVASEATEHIRLILDRHMDALSTELETFNANYVPPRTPDGAPPRQPPRKMPGTPRA